MSGGPFTLCDTWHAVCNLWLAHMLFHPGMAFVNPKVSKGYIVISLLGTSCIVEAPSNHKRTRFSHVDTNRSTQHANKSAKEFRCPSKTWTKHRRRRTEFETSNLHTSAVCHSLAVSTTQEPSTASTRCFGFAWRVFDVLSEAHRLSIFFATLAAIPDVESYVVQIEHMFITLFLCFPLGC